MGMTKIGDLARDLGCTLRALRFYEEKGIVKPARNGDRRLYDEEDVKRLKMAREWIGIGITVKQVLTLLNHYDAGDLHIVNGKLEGLSNRLEMNAADNLKRIIDFKARFRKP